jgi:hypothetical protein
MSASGPLVGLILGMVDNSFLPNLFNRQTKQPAGWLWLNGSAKAKEKPAGVEAAGLVCALAV